MNQPNDDLVFMDEPADAEGPDAGGRNPWKIIIADDHEEVHRISRLVLEDFAYENRPLKILTAFSGKETLELLAENPDVALILLDVVMETDNAGLDVVRIIREELGNHIVQIVLNTGQPGQAPEQEVITRYAINDYKTKTDFNARKLSTTVTSSLRAYSLNQALSDANDKLTEYQNHLEELVRERTSELEQANARLKMEIAERMAAERSLKENHDILDHILKASPVGICLLDNQVILWINEAMCGIFEFSSEKDYKRENGRILFESPAACEEARQALKRKLAAGEPAAVDAVLRRKGGQTFMGNLRVSPSDPTEPLEKGILTVTDITWRKQAEEDRKIKDRLQGALEVSGSICHELNQPLQYITGSTELILLDLEKDHPYYDAIRNIREQTARMGGITRKLMGISRYETRDYVGGSKILDLDKSSE